MWIARSLWLRTTTKILTSTCRSRSWPRARWPTKCKKRRLLPASWGNISKGKDRVWNKQQHPTKVLHANLRTFEPESWPIMLLRCNRGLGRLRTLRESLCRRGRRWSWRSGRGLLEWLTGRSIVLSWSFSKHDQISLHLYQVHVCLLHHLLSNDDPHMSLPISPLPICRLLHLMIFNKLKFVLTFKRVCKLMWFFFCLLDVEDLPVQQQWGREEQDDQQMRLNKFNWLPSEDFSCN